MYSNGFGKDYLDIYAEHLLYSINFYGKFMVCLSHELDGLRHVWQAVTKYSSILQYHFKVYPENRGQDPPMSLEVYSAVDVSRDNSKINSGLAIV